MTSCAGTTWKEKYEGINHSNVQYCIADCPRIHRLAVKKSEERPGFEQQGDNVTLEGTAHRIS